jgi:hypothetical protein
VDQEHISPNQTPGYGTNGLLLKIYNLLKEHNTDKIDKPNVDTEGELVMGNEAADDTPICAKLWCLRDS